MLKELCQLKEDCGSSIAMSPPDAPPQHTQTIVDSDISVDRKWPELAMKGLLYVYRIQSEKPFVEPP